MADTMNFTIQDFIEQHTAGIKEYLNKYDIQMNKLGVIGYFINVLGWTQTDIKQYVDTLFIESNVGTARQDFNLLLHGSCHKYNYNFSTAANAVGYFEFDYSLLPTKPSLVVKREVIFTNISFTVNDYPFYTDTTYRFIEDNNKYYGIISSNNNIITIPSSTQKIKLPFYNTIQKSNEIESFHIQNYPYGSYYPYNLTTDNNFISDINVYVGSETQQYDPETFDKTLWNKFEVKFIKFFEQPNDSVVFLRNTRSTEYLFEFGSGIKGLYVPDRDVVFIYSTTSGKDGNLNSYVTEIKPSMASCYMSMHESDGIIVPGSCSPDLLSITFEYSEGGKDPLTGDNLRTDIVNHIQSRSNLISEQDYYNIATKYMDDFKILFRRVGFENIMYLCRCFRDKYQQPVFTTNHITPLLPNYEDIIINNSIVDNNNTPIVDNDGRYVITDVQQLTKIIDNDGNIITSCCNPIYCVDTLRGSTVEIPVVDNNNNIVVDNNDNTVVMVDYLSTPLSIIGISVSVDLIMDINGQLELGEYEFYIVMSDGLSQMTITSGNHVNIDGINNNALSMTWDHVTGAVKYYVYIRRSGTQIYSIKLTFTPTIIINNLDTIIAPELDRDIMFYPEFSINNNVFISPFIYKYNKFMQWFEGYLLYSTIIKHISTIEYQNIIETPPSIYFNIVYDKSRLTSIIYIKSYQNISEYTFNLTLQGFNLANVELINVDENTWKLEIDSNYTYYGIIWETISLRIISYSPQGNKVLIGETEWFNQIYDVSDQVKLLKYKIKRSVDFPISFLSIPDDLKQQLDENIEYLIDIPIIDKDLFNSDWLYYTNKIYNFIIGTDLKGNRFPTDETQFRFLNTFYIDRKYLKYLLVQSYDFNIYMPLKLSITIYINNDYIIRNPVDLGSEKLEFVSMLATILQSDYTGTDIKFYNSQITDLIHTNRKHIKSVSVKVTDSTNNLLLDGIENNPSNDVLNMIMNDDSILQFDKKLLCLEYTPPFFHWDVNDINIQYITSKK